MLSHCSRAGRAWRWPGSSRTARRRSMRLDRPRLCLGRLPCRPRLVPGKARRSYAQVRLRKIPKDIFNDDADLHYMRKGDGYLLYSVGANGKDDGGKGYEDYAKENETGRAKELGTTWPSACRPSRRAVNP